MALTRQWRQTRRQNASLAHQRLLIDCKTTIPPPPPASGPKRSAVHRSEAPRQLLENLSIVRVLRGIRVEDMMQNGGGIRKFVEADLQTKSRNLIGPGALTVIAATFTLSGPAANASGYTLKTLYSFCVQNGCPDGENPLAGVVKDKSGTLYSTSYFGGKFGGGTVFSLTPKAGGYKFRTIYSFCKQAGCPDGSSPLGTLIEDVNGNLYGTTTKANNADIGTIFRLSPTDKGWKYKVLYTFCAQPNCADGGQDENGLSYKGQASGKAWDGKAPLFGTTNIGGAHGNGAIFELTPNGSQWDYTVIHDIQTGSSPNPVLVDQSGNLFITSELGGANGGGNFYTLANGTWKEGTIHNFCGDGNCSDGQDPAGTLALDAQGNVYGVTLHGGIDSNGVVFEHPASGGFAVVYDFCGDGSCGVLPEKLSYGNVSGDLFGVAEEGGANNKGVVFRLAFKNGIWSERVIEDFCADGIARLAPIPRRRSWRMSRETSSASRALEATSHATPAKVAAPCSS